MLLRSLISSEDHIHIAFSMIILALTVITALAQVKLLFI
jgi:hypothetical protein